MPVFQIKKGGVYYEKNMILVIVTTVIPACERPRIPLFSNRKIMKKKIVLSLIGSTLALFMACNSGSTERQNSSSASTVESAPAAGQSAVQDDVSAKNVVQIAIGSKDHSTLVAAVKAADLVDALSNAGPFTVFAPTNAAFDKLPPGP